MADLEGLGIAPALRLGVKQVKQGEVTGFPPIQQPPEGGGPPEGWLARRPGREEDRIAIGYLGEQGGTVGPRGRAQYQQ